MSGEEILDLRSRRARLARARRFIGHSGELLLWGIVLLGALASVYGFFLAPVTRPGYFGISIMALAAMVALWHRYRLVPLPTNTPPKQLDDILSPDVLAKLKAPLTPRSLWEAVHPLPEARFVCNRLLLHASSLGERMSNEETDTAAVWQQAAQLVHAYGSKELHAGTLLCALILQSEAILSMLMANKLDRQDVLEVLGWLERELVLQRRPKPYFGGLGRDWAMGFTPTLDDFSQNISASIERSGGLLPHHSHADLIDGIAHNLAQNSPVALIGNDGVGKTALVQGLAQHLLEGNTPSLRYYQVVNLNASLILSANASSLERLMVTLLSEAISAGNIILFLDDAHLFFANGVGAFDMGQILLPVLKNRNLKIITAFTPGDWQSLRNAHISLADSLTPVMLNEPEPKIVMDVLEDMAIGLENRHHALLSYEALREAYRLSGQYMQEQSYPGKAISLLEQAFPYAMHQVVMAESVQQAVEKTRGVRVSAAQAPEAEMLLHLEDKIHERMINQVRAVTVVAGALRRGRAGVANPKRPVGSFLFLGPTGVGKTELARSLAAVYFGDEHQMIRLDMSEYQRPEDVSRLLATGGGQEQSLLASIRQQPFSVVLLDEIEKAHANILNLLLQMLDEGQLTDEQGHAASFKSAIIIATSNAGATDIVEQIKAGGSLDDFERPLLDKLIRDGQFKPELINRFDEVVLFRPLNESELAQVANVMLREVNKTLEAQHISVELTADALAHVVHAGYDPEFGARPMRRVIQKTVENAIAVKILQGQAQPGSHLVLDIQDMTQSQNSTS